MTCLPQPRPTYRAPRVRLTDFTPAVLRLQDGGCTTGSVEVISLTGGLLCLSKPVNRGSRIKLMFLTERGPVLGGAEMLSPVSWTRQPFRFVALAYGDQRRLQTTIQESLKPVTSGPYTQQIETNRMSEREQEWIDKYRAALDKNPLRSERRLFRTVLAAITLATLCLGSAVYLISLHLK